MQDAKRNENVLDIKFPHEKVKKQRNCIQSYRKILSSYHNAFTVFGTKYQRFYF